MSCSNLLHTPSRQRQRRRLLGSGARLGRFPVKANETMRRGSPTLAKKDITSRAVSLLRNQQIEFPRLIAHDAIYKVLLLLILC